MVRMFVSDQDAVEMLKLNADCREPRQRFSFSQSSVYEDAGAFAFEQRQIARTAGRKYGYAQSDRMSPKPAK